MRIFTSFEQLDEIALPIYWALGFFDGMHRGHQRVLHAAQQQGVLCGMLSFAQHPLSLIAPARAPQLLMPSPGQKSDYAAAYGVDVLLMLPFTEALAALSPEDFLSLLARYAPVSGVSCGANWHFGRGGSGDSQLLEAYAREQGWRVQIHQLLEQDESAISSSRIRQLLGEARLSEAAALLGHGFSIRGEVIHGQQLARQWNYHTANIAVQQNTVSLPRGVYVAEIYHDGQLLRGVANLGLRPTIEEQQKRLLLELHLLDWQGDLYGQQLDVTLLHFLRPECRFGSLEELKAQIVRDAQQARLWRN